MLVRSVADKTQRLQLAPLAYRRQEQLSKKTYNMNIRQDLAASIGNPTNCLKQALALLI